MSCLMISYEILYMIGILTDNQRDMHAQYYVYNIIIESNSKTTNYSVSPYNECHP